MRADRKLLLANKAWAKEKTDLHSDFFQRMEFAQRPEVLWIGCSDSRVPAEEVTGAEPGELFVHRNVANLVVHTDLNLISVLQFAVEVLKVRHVVICGHYGCGGVKAALSHENLGIINKWLRNIKDTYRLYRAELEQIPDPAVQLTRMVELNVREQVHNIVATSIIQSAWARHQRPYIHGWVYDLGTGLLKDLISVEPGSPIDPIYHYNMEESSVADHFGSPRKDV
jgi:carbonic anhydrase